MKKVLSLVLVLTLVLGSFSMAFAAEAKTNNLADINGNANEGAIVVANDLGVVTGYPDGTFKPDNAVTRAEFAAMMTRALDIPESALKGFKTSAFKDVAADHWAVTYLGYCNSKGIMTGYEDGTARPNQTITVNEAMTMICRAIGFTNQAKELVGTWPANYISLAQQLDLYDDVKAVATVDRASAAQIVYNALPITLRYIDADGQTVPQTGAPSMLKNLGGAETNDGSGYVLQSTAADNAVINVHKYVGSFVKTWNDKDGKIIAVEELSTTMYGKYKVDGGKTTFTVDGVDYTVDAVTFGWTDKATGTAYTGRTPNEVQNGTTIYAQESTSTVDKNGVISVGGPIGALPLTLGPLASGTKYTIAVDLDGKHIKAIYSIVDWTRASGDTAFSKFKATDLKLDKQTITVAGKTYNFPTDKNNEIDYTAFVLEGVTSLDKIAVDNVVELYTADGATTGDITRLSVGTQTVEGTVDKVNKDNDEFTINGKAYGYAGKAADKPKAGDTGLARLNYDGDIVFWEESASVSGNYAVFIKAGADDSSLTGAQGVTKVGLTLKDGTRKEFELTSNANVYNANGTVRATSFTGITEGAIFTYSLNSDGKITKITLQSNTPVYGSTNNNVTAFNGKQLTSDTVVFLKDGNDWIVGSVKDFDKNQAFTAHAYVLNSDNDKIKAISADKGVVADKDNDFGVITELYRASVDNTSRWFAKGFIDGKEFTYELDGSDGTAAAPCEISATGEAVGNIGLYKITTDSNKITVTGNKVGATGVGSCEATVAAIGIVTDTNYTAGSLGTITVSGSGIVDVAKDVVVYIYNAKDECYEVGTVEALVDLRALCVQTTKDSVDDGYVTVILAWEV